MEWLEAHWLTLVIGAVALVTAWMMGRQDGLTDADKRDGTLRQDADGWVWVFDDGEWEQLWYKDNSGVDLKRPVRIENLVGMSVTPFTKKELEVLPERKTASERVAILNESGYHED